MNELCSYPDCPRKRHAKGYCTGHYHRQRLGKPLGPLQQQFFASDHTIAEVFNMYVIKKDGCWGWSGRTSSAGYSAFSLGGRQVYAHRASYELHVGPIPDEKLIDHKCHNRACVNPGHLQPVTNKQNHENRPGPQKNNTSGVRGVSWNKKRGAFEAYVTHWGARQRLGFFMTLKEAEKAVIARRNELYTNNLIDRAAVR